MNADGMIFITHDLGVIADDEVAECTEENWSSMETSKASMKIRNTRNKSGYVLPSETGYQTEKLPTVPDYMDTVYYEDGSYTVEEKEIPENWFEEMEKMVVHTSIHWKD